MMNTVKNMRVATRITEAPACQIEMVTDQEPAYIDTTPMPAAQPSSPRCGAPQSPGPAGASGEPKTSNVPTVWKETMMLSAIMTSRMLWYSRGGKPATLACSGSKDSSRMAGRRRMRLRR